MFFIGPDHYTANKFQNVFLIGIETYLQHEYDKRETVEHNINENEDNDNDENDNEVDINNESHKQLKKSISLLPLIKITTRNQSQYHYTIQELIINIVH